MADHAFEICVVRVTPDDSKPELWAAATSREQAVDRVLGAVPEGWSAFLLDTRLTDTEMQSLAMISGEVRRLSW
jgi:hypothetical protein